MGRALIEEARPPMWWIEGAGGSKAARFVRLGGQQIPISEIAAVSLAEVRDPPAAGLFLKGTLFVCFAAMLAYYVFEAGGRERFLIGMAFLAMLGATALTEASRIRGLRHYELILTLRSGERVIFTSTERADIQALALRLAAEGAGQT